jgi:hypothetical protein
MLLAKRKSLMERLAPNDAGMVPWRWLCEASNHERYGSSPTSEGIVPVKRLFLMWRICKASIFDRETGIVPTSWLLKTSVLEKRILV